MTYSFQCPADDYVAKVDAENDDEAVGKLIDKAKEHGGSVHPGMAMSQDDMEEMVRSAMQKVD